MEKLIFFGTTTFSVKILRELQKKFEVVLVISQPDKPVGRKQVLSPSPVSIFAKENKLEVIKPSSLKEFEVLEKIKSASADIFLVVAYGKIIPKAILTLAKRAALNIHGSILPKYRGASPIQAVLQKGDKSTGVTLMVMDAEMDHGPTLSVAMLQIDQNEVFEQLEARLALLASENINIWINEFILGKIKPQEQNHSQATFTKIIKKSDGLIDWNLPAGQIYNDYRAYHQWPGIYTFFADKMLKIKKCRLFTQQLSVSNLPVGSVIKFSDNYLVACGEGLLQIEEVQIEGKNQLSITDFVRGQNNFVNSVLRVPKD